MASSDTISPESAVRSYLQYLEDPSSVVDEVAVKALQEAVNETKAPEDRLKASGALQKAQSPDGAPYRADFARSARQGPKKEPVPASAFRELGVPNDVLAEAG